MLVIGWEQPGRHGRLSVPRVPTEALMLGSDGAPPGLQHGHPSSLEAGVLPAWLSIWQGSKEEEMR